MKYNKIIAMVLGGVMAVSCADLDTEPQGSTITADQKAEVIANNPDRVSASVTAITTMFSVYMNALGSGYHNDFGYPSIMLMTDSRGTDLVGIDTGYNWFRSALYLTEGGINGQGSNIAWATLYNQIYNANAVVALIDKETEDPTLKFYLAQALAIRAFDYFNLAQLFQFTYQGNEDAPCVPLVLDTNADDAAANGLGRSTVGEVYTQIMDDLNLAVELLGSSSTTRSDKRYLSYDVALGLRARVNLVMQNWAAAAADAQAAISASSATPKSMENASKPTFKSLDEEDWMWGIKIAETDRVVTSGIVNWPSHMGSLNYGYASVGAWRMINPTLYDYINDSDVRKGWFLGRDGISSNLNQDQQEYLIDAECPPFTQVKFAPYGDEIYASTNACDIPLMRIEEMYLILAEAQAMGGNVSQGAATLQTFVQTYRDPAYSVAVSTAQNLQDEVWRQRRVELWGEGLSYFDILRLRKGIDRANTEFKNVDSSLPAYNYKIDDTVAEEREIIEKILKGNGGQTGGPIAALIYQLPNKEIEANTALSTGDNNFSVPALVPYK